MWGGDTVKLANLRKWDNLLDESNSLVGIFGKFASKYRPKQNNDDIK